MIPKYSKGQVVYTQNYGIGDFEARPIVEIDLSEKAKREKTIEWIYRLPANPHGAFNWLSEESCYSSLEDLKRKWIVQILDIKESRP